jgi:hypothetical protein
MFMVQQSSLYIRLILAPFRLILMLILISSLIRSSLLLLVFVIVFIGGLIVLLVRVSSLSTQEQGIIIRQLVFIVIMIILLFKETYIVPVSDFIPLVFWVSDRFTINYVLVLLVTSLLVITALVFKFKGLVRRVCLYGVKHIPLSRGSIRGCLVDNWVI